MDNIVMDDNPHTKDVCLNEVYLFLKENGFEQYWSSFDSNGYDNIQQLTEMSPDELEEVFDDVKMTKKGHRKRLKALLAIRSVQETKRVKKQQHRKRGNLLQVRNQNVCKSNAFGIN